MNFLGGITQNIDCHIIHDTVKVLAYMLQIYETETTIRSSRVKAFIWKNDSDLDISIEDRNLEMIGNTCSILEMSIRRGIADCEATYNEMGSTLVLLLLKVIECCLESSRTEGDNGEMVLLRGAVLSVNKATEIICHVSRLSLHVRESIASIPGVLSILIRLAESTITAESQVNAYCAIANLSCEPNNVSLLASEPDLMSLLQFAVTKEEMSNEEYFTRGNGDLIKNHSLRALMNLAASKHINISVDIQIN
jgi:hypothetical protein